MFAFDSFLFVIINILDFFKYVYVPKMSRNCLIYVNCDIDSTWTNQNPCKSLSPYDKASNYGKYNLETLYLMY